MKEWQIERISVDSIKAADYNPRQDIRDNEEMYETLKLSLEKFGLVEPLILNERTGTLVGGHQRLQTLKEMGETEVEVVKINVSEQEEKALNIALNKIDGQWNEEKLFHLLKEITDDGNLELTGFTEYEMEALGEVIGIERINEARQIIEEAPPKITSTIFSQKQNGWLRRKHAWEAIGLKSEEGRKDNLITTSTEVGGRFARPEGKKQITVAVQTSIFDVVLCEAIYETYSKVGDTVFDSFAGGSVRGIVADKHGRKYTGIDLRAEQVEANRRQADKMGFEPTWHVDDSQNADLYIKDNTVDLYFSCPPYADLEVYSDDPRDISNMEYDKFLEIYTNIIQKGVNKLKDDKYAVFVVGDVRDEKGNYRDFISDTIEAFEKAGATFIQECILAETGLNAIFRGKVALQKSRKIAKTHQNILVFKKVKA